MFNLSGRAGNYAYTVSRVKAKKALLLKTEDYDKMLQMSIPEISHYISECGYQKEMTDLAVKFEGVDLVEYATYANMARVFGSIIGASQGELNTMVAAYLQKWDVWNLKVILRGKIYGLSTDVIRENLVPAGSVKADMLEKLISFDSPEDIISNFCRAVHGPYPADLVSGAKASGNYAWIEDSMDRQYYVTLLKSIDASSRSTKMFQDYVRAEIDIKNFGTIFKLKAEDVPGDTIMMYMIPGGKQIDGKLAQQLANADSVAAAAGDIAQLDFYEVIRESVESGNFSPRDFILKLKRYELDSAKKFSHMYPLSVCPILDYMIHKENEIANIRTISRGIESGLDPETIKGLLVI